MWRMALLALTLGVPGEPETPAKLVCAPASKPLRFMPDAGPPPGFDRIRCGLEAPRPPPNITPPSVVDQPAGLPLNLYTGR
ncbi:MAG: hypothetical protein JST54_13640 [Deltaproteobacteria bacterium]|nr:hypothetical protein [Deltaproteobacteria bacterium]